MEWVDGLPKDLEQLENAARKVGGLQDVPLSDLSRLLDRLNDAGFVVRNGRRPLLRRIFGGARVDQEAIVSAAAQVEDLDGVKPSTLEELLSKLAQAGLIVAEKGE